MPGAGAPFVSPLHATGAQGHNSVEVQKNPDYEMWNDQILSGTVLANLRTKKSG